MFKRALKLLGLGRSETEVADRVLGGVVNKATHGAAGKVDDAVQAVEGEVRRRKRKR